MCTVTLKSLKQFSIRKQIIAAIVLTSILKSVHLKQCSKLSFNKKHFGQRLVGFKIVNSTEDSIGTCLKKFFQLAHCLSTNFDTVSKQCDLNNITAMEITTAVVKSDTSVLSDLSAWPKDMVGSCGDKPCNGSDICMPAGKSFLCRNSDCPKAPLFRNTMSTGSVAIGGKMVYNCTQPFHRVSRPDYVQCGWMNTWSSNVEITCTAECPDEWIRYYDSCYLFYTRDTMTFSEAVNYCEGFGADIVQIEYEDENLFVKEKTIGNSGVGFWLGLTDETDGVWKWYKTGELATYSHWHADGIRPSNGNCFAFFVIYETNYEEHRWANVECSQERLPICEVRLPV